MTETRAIGFKLRRSEAWVWLMPEHVVAVCDEIGYDGDVCGASIRSSGGREYHVDGRAQAVAAVIWPDGED